MRTEPTRLKGRLQPVETPSGAIRLVLNPAMRLKRELRRGRAHRIAGLAALAAAFALGIALGVLACAAAPFLTRTGAPTPAAAPQQNRSPKQ